MYAVWGADLNPQNVTWADNVAVNPGILRPNWYGNCVATYGLRSVSFRNLTCKVLTHHQELVVTRATAADTNASSSAPKLPA